LHQSREAQLAARPRHFRKPVSHADRYAATQVQQVTGQLQRRNLDSSIEPAVL
jgi:hypothetical protein